MKTLFLILSLLAGSVLTDAAPASEPRRNITIILSPYYDDADRTAVEHRVLGLLFSASAGSKVAVVDGWNLQKIAELEIPELRIDSPAARRRALREPLARLLVWFKESSTNSPPASLRGSAALRIPEGLAYLTSAPSKEPRSVVLIGSPIYVSQTEPSYSMTGDRFPSDGHLFCSEDDSLYGLMNKGGRLRGFSVHVWYLREGLFSSALYKSKVQRFWTLFVSGQAGTLASFTADGLQALNAATRAGLEPVGVYPINPRFGKVEMLRVVREIETRTLTNHPPTIDFSAVTRPANSPKSEKDIVLMFERSAAGPTAESEREIVTALEREAAGQTAVGIMWKSPGIDLDLYVFPAAGAAPLYFGNGVTSSGRFIHDYRDANVGTDWERVVLNSTAHLGELKAYVNFFGGATAEPVEGKVVFHHDGKTVHGTFRLRASAGNAGADLALRDSSPFWTELKLSELLLANSR